MKKDLVYIVLIVLIMSVFTGCNNKETKDKEIIQEDNGVTSENIVKENDTEDSNDVIQDANNTLDDNTEIEQKEVENKDNEKKENENKESENKENENIVKENKESENKESENKANKNIENEKKESENKENVNKENQNKESQNKEDKNKKEDNKNENKEIENKEKENNKNENKEKDNSENESKDESNDQNVADIDLVTIIDNIYKIKDPGLRLVNTPLDLSNSDSMKYNTGLSDISKIKQAVVSESMMGSQAYSLVLVQVNDVDDAESVANEMLNGINPRKWICVDADDLQVVSHDDVIMLFMVSSSLEENITSQQMVDAFKEVCDGELDIKLKK